MSVKVDLSQVHALTRAAIRSADRMPSRMQKIVADAAKSERGDHEYNNQTGNLEASTRALDVIEVGDQMIVDLVVGDDGAGVDYAGYVYARGLMHIDENAEVAERELDYFFDGEVLGLAVL